MRFSKIFRFFPVFLVAAATLYDGRPALASEAFHLRFDPGALHPLNPRKVRLFVEASEHALDAVFGLILFDEAERPILQDLAVFPVRSGSNEVAFHLDADELPSGRYTLSCTFWRGTQIMDRIVESGLWYTNPNDLVRSLRTMEAKQAELDERLQRMNGVGYRCLYPSAASGVAKELGNRARISIEKGDSAMASRALGLVLAILEEARADLERISENPVFDVALPEEDRFTLPDRSLEILRVVLTNERIRRLSPPEGPPGSIAEFMPTVFSGMHSLDDSGLAISVDDSDHFILPAVAPLVDLDLKRMEPILASALNEVPVLGIVSARELRKATRVAGALGFPSILLEKELSNPEKLNDLRVVFILDDPGYEPGVVEHFRKYVEFGGTLVFTRDLLSLSGGGLQNLIPSYAKAMPGLCRWNPGAGQAFLLPEIEQEGEFLAFLAGIRGEMLPDVPLLPILETSGGPIAFRSIPYGRTSFTFLMNGDRPSWITGLRTSNRVILFGADEIDRKPFSFPLMLNPGGLAILSHERVEPPCPPLRSLWNEMDLTGWTIHGDESWEVWMGEIVGSSTTGGYGYLATEKSYSDFEAECEFFCEADGNSGFFFRSRLEGTDIQGIQAEVNPLPDGKLSGLYESGGRGWIATPPENVYETIYRPNQWNRMRVRAEGPRIQVWLNGIRTIDFTDPDLRHTEGVIALQIHNGGGVKVRWKHLYIREIR